MIAAMARQANNALNTLLNAETQQEFDAAIGQVMLPFAGLLGGPNGFQGALPPTQ